MSGQDYYQLLGVGRNFSEKELRRAYRKLAKELHPDHNPDNPEAEAKFKKVCAAYEVLSDPEKRRLYDRYGDASTASGFQEGFFRSPAGQSFQDLFGGAGGGFGFSMDDLFGGRGIQDIFQRRTQKARPAKDVESEVTIDFVESVRGCQREFTISFGHHDKSLKVRIPGGIGDGEKLRLRGQGQPPNGDLVLLVRVKPHEFFRREGMNLILDLPITPLEAYRGAQIRVPTPDGHVSLKIPERTASFSRLRVRGKGVQRKGKAGGDLIVRIVIATPAWPDEPSEALESAVEALEELYVGDPRAHIRF